MNAYEDVNFGAIVSFIVYSIFIDGCCAIINVVIIILLRRFLTVMHMYWYQLKLELCDNFITVSIQPHRCIRYRQF